MTLFSSRKNFFLFRTLTSIELANSEMEQIYLLITQPEVELVVEADPEPSNSKSAKKPKRKATTEVMPKVVNNTPVKNDTDSMEIWTSKIGYDRSIHFARSKDEVSIFMGLTLEKPGTSSPTSKTIQLTSHQFLRLYGLLFSGNADCAKRKNSTKEEGSLTPLFYLSGDVYFT